MRVFEGTTFMKVRTSVVLIATAKVQVHTLDSVQHSTSTVELHFHFHFDNIFYPWLPARCLRLLLSPVLCPLLSIPGTSPHLVNDANARDTRHTRVIRPLPEKPMPANYPPGQATVSFPTSIPSAWRKWRFLHSLQRHWSSVAPAILHISHNNVKDLNLLSEKKEKKLVHAS